MLLLKIGIRIYLEAGGLQAHLHLISSGLDMLKQHLHRTRCHLVDTKPQMAVPCPRALAVLSVDGVRTSKSLPKAVFMQVAVTGVERACSMRRGPTGPD